MVNLAQELDWLIDSAARQLFADILCVVCVWFCTSSLWWFYPNFGMMHIFDGSGDWNMVDSANLSGVLAGLGSLLDALDLLARLLACFLWHLLIPAQRTKNRHLNLLNRYEDPFVSPLGHYRPLCLYCHHGHWPLAISQDSSVHLNIQSSIISM